MKIRTAIAKWTAARAPWVKYALIAVGVGLWAFGLFEQLHSSETTIKYLALSLLLAAIAVA
jgi:hypothetical protein